MSHLRRVVLVAVAAMAVSSVVAVAASADSLWATCSWGEPVQTQTCDSTAWYPSAVTVVWQTQPAADSQPPPSCLLGVNYHYDTDTVTTLSCTASVQGTINSKLYTLHVETSTPIVSASLARAPDSNGWYTYPVGISFSGSSFSGIESCTPPTTFSGPNMMGAVVSGSCTDWAGKTADASVSLSYDSTPPSVQASARPGDQDVRLSWQSANAATLTISRSPGTHGAADSVVHQGGDGIFNDTDVTNGVHYTYTISARDQAGYVTVRTLHVTPGLRVLSPVGAARVTLPPLLTWTFVPHASYYNVQVYRGAGQILSAWPSYASLGLSRSWRFEGHRFRLKPGRYRWYVWPGFGARRSARYGKLIGTGTFVVARFP